MTQRERFFQIAPYLFIVIGGIVSIALVVIIYPRLPSEQLYDVEIYDPGTGRTYKGVSANTRMSLKYQAEAAKVIFTWTPATQGEDR